jgi:SAM-dependent methyltransferase
MFTHKKFNPQTMSGKKILDIGCGNAKLKGAVGLDSRNLPGVDVVSDLNQRLPFDNDSFDVVYANQVLEHVQELIGLLHEIHRVLRPGGFLVAHTPYFRSSWAHIDPTHVRHFTISTLDYFVKGTYCNNEYKFGDVAFSRQEVFLDTDYRWSPARAFFSTLALRWPFRFENSTLSFIYPFEQITFVLTK